MSCVIQQQHYCGSTLIKRNIQFKLILKSNYLLIYLVSRRDVGVQRIAKYMQNIMTTYNEQRGHLLCCPSQRVNNGHHIIKHLILTWRQMKYTTDEQSIKTYYSTEWLYKRSAQLYHMKAWRRIFFKVSQIEEEVDQCPTCGYLSRSGHPF